MRAVRGRAAEYCAETFQIAVLCRLTLCGAGELSYPDDFGNAIAEALKHTVGLRMARQREAALNARLLTETVEQMLATRYLFAQYLPLFAGETTCEPAAVVGQQLDDFEHGTGGAGPAAKLVKWRGTAIVSTSAGRGIVVSFLTKVNRVV